MTVGPNQREVEEALDQCEEDFERGMNSHGSPPPSVQAGIVGDLRAKLKPHFHQNLVVDKRTWHGPGGDRNRITRMAFYLGAIAAFHAHADSKPGADPVVTQEHVDKALSYVNANCTGPAGTGPAALRPLWIYCGWGDESG